MFAAGVVVALHVGTAYGLRSWTARVIRDVAVRCVAAEYGGDHATRTNLATGPVASQVADGPSRTYNWTAPGLPGPRFTSCVPTGPSRPCR